MSFMPPFIQKTRTLAVGAVILLAIVGYVYTTNRVVGEIEIVEVWSGAYGYENLTKIEGSVATEAPHSAPITELFFSKYHEPAEYYTTRYFTDKDVESFETLKGVEVVKGLMYQSAWSPDTPKWREHETWSNQIKWNRSLESEDSKDIQFMENMEIEGSKVNMSGLEYYLSISQTRFPFDILGIETEKLRGVDSWFNKVKDGRPLEPNEKNAILISSHIAEDVGLSVGDVISVPLGGINEYSEAAGTRVDTRTSYNLTVVGIIYGGTDEDAVVDLGFLMDALTKGAGELSDVLPLYSRFFLKTKSQEIGEKVKDMIELEYPDAAILIRGKMSLQGFFR